MRFDVNLLFTTVVALEYAPTSMSMVHLLAPHPLNLSGRKGTPQSIHALLAYNAGFGGY